VRFALDPRSPVPPSEQLAHQVRFAVAAGRLAAGDRLPPVRALAVEARVNPNTVLRAWRELELTGVLESRRGDGMFVAAGARERCRESCERLVAERIGRAVSEALEAGFGGERVLDWVRRALAPRPEREAS